MHDRGCENAKPKCGKCPRTTTPYTNSTKVIAAGGGGGLWAKYIKKNIGAR